MKKTLYIICNSHLDPVWLWDRSSGRSSWLNTMHSAVRILEEQPDLKFTCSAAALYRWVEECDPALFRKIRNFAAEGRWEIVGGWEVQSDVILSRPVTLYHQAESAKKYFLDCFGVDVDIAYNVDAFGHPAGLPKVLNATGFKYYVYTRSHNVPPLFRWCADDGSAVTALHIINSYGTGAGEAFLKEHLQLHLDSPLEHQAMFFGVGDHGGGVSRKELAFLREMQQKYSIVFSTLKEYFEVVKDLPLPTVTGELGPIFRGCYSNCHEVKRKIARGTRRLLTAEKLGVPSSELEDPWRELCFNHFHDILPGTSIRRAYEKDVFPGLGSVEHRADELIDRQLFRRTAELDTMYMKEGGVYCWNPHPFRHQTLLSFNGFADPNKNGVNFNALRDEEGNEIPLQFLQSDSTFGPCGVPWGKLTAVIDLPPMGEKTFAYTVSAREFPAVGYQRQRELLEKLSLEVFFDNSRTWGFGLTAFDSKIGTMELLRTRELCSGPVCSILQAFYKFRDSEVRLDLYDYAGIPEIGIRIRLDWHEPMSALKLACFHDLPGEVEFFTGTCADTVCRMGKKDYMFSSMDWRNGVMCKRTPASEEFSMIDWCAVLSEKKTAAFFAPDLHSCDYADGQLRLTVVHPVLYADHKPFPQDEEDGWQDSGVSYRFLWFALYDAEPLSSLPKLAQKRLYNGEVREITAHPAGETWGKSGFLQLELPQDQITVQEFRRNDAGEIELTLQNSGGEIPIDLPVIGRSMLPAWGLKTFKWKE